MWFCTGKSIVNKMLLDYRKFRHHRSVGWNLLNLKKCKHLTITNQKSPINSSNSHFLCKVKNLGVTITHRHDHIAAAICSKANSTRAFLQRNLRQCSFKVKSLAYLTNVRPILKYSSTVWSPYTKSDIAKLEMVQRKAARYVFKLSYQ